MNFELFVALRYLRAKRKQAVISVITVISILGVASGVMALIVALSISAGFREDLQSKLLRGTSHINVLPKEIRNGISNYPLLAEKIRKVPGVETALPAIYQVVLIIAGRQQPVYLKGIAVEDPSFFKDAFFDIKSGYLRDLVPPLNDPVRDRIALGEELAKKIGTFVGDYVSIISDEGELTPIGTLPVRKRMKVVAIFSSGLSDFDSQWGFTSLATAQRLFGTGELVSLIECKVSDIYQVKTLSEKILAAVGPEYVTKDWIEQYQSIFHALKMEKIVMVITIGLIVFVAALNIITVLIMMVMEKNRDIAVLMSMGATQAQIRKLFVLQGLVIGLVGSTLGLVLGNLTCWVCDRYELIRLETDVYSISHVPFKTNFLDGFWVAMAAIGISLIATIYPSKKAASLDPVEALRYE
ncbi:MAG: ABC transporter permease [Terriglobia bacterium]